ncbi:hypothetical protein M3Y94_01014200 [Aphelenchoides besseyi]|nr:hypothetical protein M3Y94_01014200 [Aphelenchoides besseyi]KAI6220523.1 hypothetical protein M3Y95_01049300 [Aphelenchoides besseyi]
MEKLREKLAIKNELAKALLGEFLGTAILVLAISSTVSQSVLHSKPNQMVNINLGVGLGIAFGIAVCARVSGGHINPAVSLMFLTFRQISAVKFALYVLVQTLGAFFGALVTYIVYSDAISTFDGGERQIYGSRATAHIFASYPAAHLSFFNGLLDQIVATAVFCLIIAHTVDKRNNYPTWVQPFVIGTGFVLIGSAFALNAGYPCNPARDFGPRLFTLIFGYGTGVFGFNNWWIVPIVGPFIGAIVGGWIYEVLVGFQTPESSDYQIVATQNGSELHVITHQKDKPQTAELVA